MRKILTIRNVLIAIPTLILLVALHYALPQVDVVRAVGVEVKRVDVSESGSGQQRTRDVYQLQMETPDGSPKVYRNEDNFLYGKFDSADLQAQVQSLSKDKQLVAIRHYGWRLKLFSTFPNALKVWPVEAGYRHIPIFNIVVLLGIGFLVFYIVRRVRRASHALLESRRAAEAEREERQAAAARDAQAAAELGRETERKKQDDVDAFLNSDGNKKD